MFFRLVRQFAEKEGVTEELKNTDQMAWIGAMNNMRSRAREIVYTDIIYAVDFFTNLWYNHSMSERQIVIL